MGKKIVKIINFKTTETNKCFCLSIDNEDGTFSKEMYYADIEDTNNLDKFSYNKCCLRNNDKLYSAIYNVKDLYLKSAIYGNNIETNIPNTNSFLNIFDYRLSSSLTNQIQVENYIYQLNNMSIYGKLSYTQDIYAELSMNNGYAKMPNVQISTCLFDPAIIKLAKEDDTIEISGRNDLSCVLYNQFFEIPGTIKNDFDSGNYCVNVYTTKNLYDSLYDMSHNVNNKLINARQYIAIDNCNNQIYLKYYDNIYYDNNDVLSKEDKCLYNHKYQKIEVLKQLNRFESINSHKTNYYDVVVICEKMLLSFNDEITIQLKEKSDNIQKVKDNIIYEIQNCIYDICKLLSPIDTLLIKVNVKDSELEL